MRKTIRTMLFALVLVLISQLCIGGSVWWVEALRRAGWVVVEEIVRDAVRQTLGNSPEQSQRQSARSGFMNSIGMEFVLIPPGSFQMGCSSESEDCASDEKPRHEVEISQAFLLGKYEVTQAQWEAVMGNNPSWFEGAKYPVENVSWNDVQEFIAKLLEKEGVQYRLPTEAEWEYAARAGSRTAYCFGDDKNQLRNYAWYDREDGMHPVGKKMPNAWGLYDMHGNVWEWVQDWYGGYSDGFERDPEGPRAGG